VIKVSRFSNFPIIIIFYYICHSSFSFQMITITISPNPFFMVPVRLYKIQHEYIPCLVVNLDVCVHVFQS
jgi:hypothetical protein